MVRPVDHLVLAVPDLEAAMAFYRAVGFTVGARNRHPWGTENAIVQLDGAFLELIGLGDGFLIPPHDDPASPFARAVAEAVACGGGLRLVAMGSRDADADARTFAEAGLGQGRRLDFGRTAEAPDGSRRTVAFELSFVDDPALPGAGLFACRHLHPETFWNPDAQVHANTALRLDAIVLAADEPRRHEAAFATICDTRASGADGHLSFETPTGRLEVMTPTEAVARFGVGGNAGRFVAFSVAVASVDAVRGRLDDAKIAFDRIAGGVVIPSASAFGVALAFVPEPCHSHR